MKLKYRILAALAVAAIALLYYLYPCLILRFNGIPDYNLLKKNGKIEKIILLYGSGICHSCSTGNFLNSLTDGPNVLFVVPGDYSAIDIENLRETFNIKGPVIKGKNRTIDFLKSIADCKRLKSWRNNYYITLDTARTIKTISRI